MRHGNGAKELEDETQKHAVHYNGDWYSEQSKGSLNSARRIAPIVFDLIKPKAVLDIGCGVGTWLRVFSDLGAETVLGLDGAYVDRSLLQIPDASFVSTDLRSHFVIDRQFDLAICLEVAEHLPLEYCDHLVEQLTKSAPNILFSAAIPGQRGTDHINEQWQDYWRKLFADRGYDAVDFVRPKVWGIKDVEYWYQQNTILYCSEEVLRNRPEIRPIAREVSLNVVHPTVFNRERGENVHYLSKTVSMLPGLVASAISKRLGIKRET